VPKWHTCDTVAGPLNSSAAPPFPHRIPSIPPPPPLPTKRGDTVGIRRGKGDPQCAILAHFWHSSGSAGYWTASGKQVGIGGFQTK